VLSNIRRNAEIIEHLSEEFATLSIRRKAYGSIRQRIRQHTSAHTHLNEEFATLIEHAAAALELACIRQHMSAYVSIRQHTSAYVSIRHEELATRIEPGLKLAFAEGAFEREQRSKAVVKQLQQE
jgi:hypothetical protein